MTEIYELFEEADYLLKADGIVPKELISKIKNLGNIIV